jgi:hypothetical protein
MKNIFGPERRISCWSSTNEEVAYYRVLLLGKGIMTYLAAQTSSGGVRVWSDSMEQDQMVMHVL